MQRATTPPPERGEQQFTDAQLEAALQLMWNDYSVRPQWIIVPPEIERLARRLMHHPRPHVGGCSARARKRILCKAGVKTWPQKND